MNNKLSVVQINILGSKQSTGRTTRELHNYLLSQGHSSYIATAYDIDSPDSFKITTRFLVRVDVLMTMLTGLESYHSTIQTYRLIKWLEQINPDIVHLRNLHHNFINLGILLRYLAKNNICTVLTLHDMWFITGKCTHFEIYQCNKWTTGCYNCPSLKDDRKKRLFDRTPRMWRDKKKWLTSIKHLAAIGNSRWTTEQIKKSYLNSAEIKDCIYNWIDHKVFFPREEMDLKNELMLSKKKVIIAVSTYWTLKGNKGLTKYLSLAESMPSDYHLVLIGNLKDKIQVPDKVSFIKEISDPCILSKYYSIADVYLNLSKCETFGKAAAEAVCCGTPLITLDNTANKEIVPPDAGIILKTDSLEEILNGLKKIFSKPKSMYTEACLRHAERNFSKEKNIEEYIKIYNELRNSRNLDSTNNN